MLISGRQKALSNDKKTVKTNWVLAVLILAFSIGVSFFACSSSKGDDDDVSDDGDNDDDSGGNNDDDTGVSDDDSSDDDSANDDDTSGDTWTDSSSGLTWPVTPSSDYMTWDDAKTYCVSLTLAGGGWHLPTISELRALIRGCDATVTGGACTATDECLDSSCWNDACGGCASLAGPGSGGAYWPDGMSGEIGKYWSSSPVAGGGDNAWNVDFNDGSVNDADDVNATDLAHCVR